MNCQIIEQELLKGILFTEIKDGIKDVDHISHSTVEGDRTDEAPDTVEQHIQYTPLIHT